ncbi:MAG: Gfo/Idh/MocA family oxidoreductase [Bacteroidota bacterium]
MRLGKEKPFGPINLIEGSLGYHMPDPTHWRLDKAKGGGGAIMDLGVYPIQAARYITGEEPLSVTAQGVIRDKKRFKDIYESISWQFRFPSGAMSNHTTTYSSYTDHLRVGCYQGWFGLKPAFGAGRLNGYKMNEPLDFPEVNQQALHMDDFAQSIQDNKPVKVGGEEGLQDIRIVQAILKAADTGREVMIKGE